MEREVKVYDPQRQELTYVNQETTLLDGKFDSNPGIRKSSRPRKQSKRVLDSVDCNDIELLDVPQKKKHRKELKLKIHRKKDILPNGRPFKCSLCESPYINNSPAKAKIKKELEPIVKEKFGQLLQLCVKCAIAVNHTENKGPTPEQRAEFEEEGRQFAQHLVEYLNDSAAARLYCSFYQTTKCGCIQCYISGTPAGRKRKTSLSGLETSSDAAELKQEEGTASVDEKTEQTQRAKHLLGLLKESMAKRQIPNAKKSQGEKQQQGQDDTVNSMRESERFILENRIKLKELGICERGCQKVLCYSNNFLHKKPAGSQPRLQRTRGRAALGRLHPLPEIYKMKCCDKFCVKLVEKNQSKMAVWRQRAQQSQKEMWKVLEEMLTFTESGKTNCFKFISMVTGCCLTTVQKVYADVLLSKGSAGCASKREHGMRFHWRRQKELGKRGQHTASVAKPNQSQVTPVKIEAHTVISEPQTATLPPVLELNAGKKVCNEESSSNVLQSTHFRVIDTEENEDKKDIQEKFLKLIENIQDPQEIAQMQELFAKVQRDLQIKKEKESSQQSLTSQPFLHFSGSPSDPRQSSSSTPLFIMLNSSNNLSSSSNGTSDIMLHTAHSSTATPDTIINTSFDQNLSTSHTTKQDRPFVHTKVQHKSNELKRSVKSGPQQPSQNSNLPTTPSISNNSLYHSLSVAHSDPETASKIVDASSTQIHPTSSQLHIHPLDLSNLNLNPGLDNTVSTAVTPISLPLGIISNNISPFVLAPQMTVPSLAENTLTFIPPQAHSFQVLPHAENSKPSTQTSQILSVHPQQAPLQMQPVPASSNNMAQLYQLQLVSPLILGQSDLTTSLTQSSLTNEALLHILPVSCNSSIDHKDSTFSHDSSMQQSFQNLPEFPQTLLNSNNVLQKKSVSGLTTETCHNFSNNDKFYHVINTNQDSGLSSQGVLVHEYIQNQNENASEVPGDVSDHKTQSKTIKKPHCPDSSPITQFVRLLRLLNCEDKHDAESKQQNIDRLYHLLSDQPPGNVVFGTPSSSASFVFDALADSPVKDSFSLSQPPLQASTAVTSSLLCEILMRSTAPSMPSMSSTLEAPYISPSVMTLSSQPSLSTHQQSSLIVSCTKSPLLVSALKSRPTSSSAYCQSLNFNTNTTPSTMSNQPVIMTGKVEQVPVVTTTAGHNTSLAHPQMAMSRLNRQREPPQIGIVHPHISGVKGGHTVISTASFNCNNSSISSSTPQVSSIDIAIASSPLVHPSLMSSSSSSIAHPTLISSLSSTSSIVHPRFVPSSASSSSSSSNLSLINPSFVERSQQPTSHMITADSSNYQISDLVPESSTDTSTVRSYQQPQQIFLSLLLNSPQTGSLIDQPVINPPQVVNQINLTTVLGNHVLNTASIPEDLGQNIDNQNKIITNNCNSVSHKETAECSQYISNNKYNTLSDQGQLLDQTSVSVGNQNILQGNENIQIPAEASQIFQSLTTANTGQLKFIPLILSGTNCSSSAPKLPQNSQLLLNVSPCAGQGYVSSLSNLPNLNAENSFILNMSPNSNQNMQLLQVVGSSQISSSQPLTTPNIQNINHIEPVNSTSTNSAKTYQLNMMPFLSSQTMPQTKSQTNNEELQSNVNISNPDYTFTGPVRPVTKVTPTNKQQTAQPSQETPTSILGRNTTHLHSNLSHKIESNSNQRSVYSLMKDKTKSANSQNKVQNKPNDILATNSTLAHSKRNSNSIQIKHNLTKINDNLTQVDDSPNNLNDNQTEEKVYASNLQAPYSSTIQHHLVPVKGLNVLHTQGQPDVNEVVSSEYSRNVILNSSTAQSFGLNQQIQSAPNLSSANQISLPVQPISVNMSTNSSLHQQGQQLSNVHTIVHPMQDSSMRNDSSSSILVSPVIELTKSANMLSSNSTSSSTRVQQNPSASALCVSTSKHRPIRPKLLPVPAPTPPKITLMLVPDKSGCATFQLTQHDPSVLSFQPISEQKEKPLSQIQIISQDLQNSTLFSGTVQSLQNALIVPGTPEQSQNTPLVPGTPQQSQNTFLVSGTPQQSQNTFLVPGTSQQSQNTFLVSETPQQSQKTVFVPGASQQSQNTVLVPENFQQPQNAVLPSVTSEETPNAVFGTATYQQQQNIIVVPETSQQTLSTFYIPGTHQQTQNPVLLSEISQPQHDRLVFSGASIEPQKTLILSGTPQKQIQQRPLLNSAIMTHLQSEQQPNIKAQILLVSEPHLRQEVQGLSQPILPHQEKTFLQSQPPETNNSILPTLDANAQKIKSAGHQINVSEILPQQNIVQADQSQVTLLAYETSGITFSQDIDLKTRSLHSGHLQALPSQDHVRQIQVSHDRSEGVYLLPSGSLSAKTLQSFEVPDLQGSVYETMQHTVGAGSSRPDSRQGIIDGLNATPQLNEQHIEMAAHVQQTPTNSSTSEDVLATQSSSCVPLTHTTKVKIKESQITTTKSHSIKLHTSSSFPGQSKPVSEYSSGASVVDKDRRDRPQNSSHSSSYNCNVDSHHNLYTNDVLTSNIKDVFSNLSSYSSNQSLDKLMRPTLADVNKITSNEDIKSSSKPVQYLQSQDIIDLTDDSPPLSPSSRNIASSYPIRNFLIVNDQDQSVQSTTFDELYSLLINEHQKSDQQPTTFIPIQFQRAFQQNPTIENQYMLHKSNHLKQGLQEACKTSVEVMPDKTTPNKFNPLKRELDDSHKTLTVTEHGKVALVTSVKECTKGNGQVNNLIQSSGIMSGSSKSFVSANVSSKHTENNLGFVAKDMYNSMPQNTKINSSTCQKYSQSITTGPSLESTIDKVSVPSNCELNKIAIINEDNNRQTLTSHRPHFINMNNSLILPVSKMGHPVSPKQLVCLSSTSQGQSKHPERVSSLSTGQSDQTPLCSSSSISSVASFNNSHKFQISGTSPSPLTAALIQAPTSISTVRPSVGRMILHPLTSSAVTFVRTTNTPTDAIGPPNVTIMSPAQSSSSPLLRILHDKKPVTATTTTINQTSNSTFSSSLSMMTKDQNSSVLKLSNSDTVVPLRIQGSQDTKLSALQLCSSGKDKVTGHPIRRLSLENVPHTSDLKEAYSSEVPSPSISSKPTDSELKSVLPTPKPRIRKRQCTVMDLLRNKEKLQANAPTVSSSGLALSATPGPVTLMLSGTAGSPNLVVMDPPTGQTGVDTNTLNITVKNLQLLGKLPNNSSKTLPSSSTTPTGHSTGFTILQPNILQASLSSTSNAITQSSSQAATKETTIASLASLPSSFISTNNTALLQPTFYLPIPQATSDAPKDSHFLGNKPQPHLLLDQQDVSNQHKAISNHQLALSNQSTGYGNQGMEVILPGLKFTTLGETSRNTSASVGQSSELKTKSFEVLNENKVKLVLIGQPQVASSVYNSQQSVIELLPQMSQPVRAESASGEFLKFKTTHKPNNEDKTQELISSKYQQQQEVAQKTTQSIEKAGTSKKLLLLNEKLPETLNKQFNNSTLVTSLQAVPTAGHISSEEKLSFKSPQLLQLMKSKQPFPSTVLDQPTSLDKPQLKLPTSSVGMFSFDNNSAYNSRPGAVLQSTYHLANKILSQKDKLPTMIAQSVSNEELRGNTTEPAENKSSNYEPIPDTRRNILPSQNPLLANILFTSVSDGMPNIPAMSVNTSSYSANKRKISLEKKKSFERSSNINETTTLGIHASTKELQSKFSEVKTEPYFERTVEKLFRASSEQNIETNLKTNSHYQSEFSNKSHVYNQPPCYEVATKDMTRVNRVIEDMYKFSDEWEDTSLPSSFTGYKSQNELQKSTFAHTGSMNRKTLDSTLESSMMTNPAVCGDSVSHTAHSKSIILPATAQLISGQCVEEQVAHADRDLDESSHTWRNIKKLRHNKDLGKFSNKFNLKKVQFSDVVSSKSVSEYGPSLTANSQQIMALPNEFLSSYFPDAQLLRSYPDISGSDQHQQAIAHYFPGQEQTLAEDRHGSQEISGRYPCVTEQLQADSREYKLKLCHTGHIGASLPKLETVSAYAKDQISDLVYSHRGDEDRPSGSDFDADSKDERESQKHISYQRLPKENHRLVDTSFVEYEQDYKRINEEDTDQYFFQKGFVQENMDNMPSAIGEKNETSHKMSVQSTAKSSSSNVQTDSFRTINKDEDFVHRRSESGVREATKMKQLLHDEDFHFNTGSDSGVYTFEKKHYQADMIDLSTDQQSSFNILSRQGYFRLSKQSLNRVHNDQAWIAGSTPLLLKDTHLVSQAPGICDTISSSHHLEVTNSYPQQTSLNSLSSSNTSVENLDRQSSESPLIRHKVLETNFELARQMNKGNFQVLKDSRSENFEIRKLESPHKLILYPERKAEMVPMSLTHRGNECQISKEVEYRSLSSNDSVSASPTFLASLDGRQNVLSSIESITSLRKEIKGLRGENQYLKLEVAKAEQQRHRQLSSTDKQKGILVEAEKVEKICYVSPGPGSQGHATSDVDSVMPLRKRHTSSTVVSNCSPNLVSDQSRPEEGLLSKYGHPGVASSGIQPSLDVYGSIYARGINNVDEYSPQDNFIKDRDQFMPLSVQTHSRPNSHLELGAPPYESTRNRYPSSEMKPVSSRGVSDDEGFAPIQEPSRRRNLSSSLGRVLLEDPPPYDFTQRQRNLSTSSLKSSFQDSELSNLDLGARSRNPSSSSWIRYLDYTTDINISAVRSRNPSGSSNRRSRPNSSSSDREFSVNLDELPFFSEFARTRSRNSSGESIEPTIDIDPQQFIQYAYSDAHIKRTKH